MMKLKNKKIVIVGLGRTGLAVARFLHQQGARIVATDTANEAALGDTVAQLRHMDIEIELGAHGNRVFQESDLIVVSPGVSHTIAPIARARSKGVEVVGEVELAARFIQTPIVAVTGTNGKTTTTELLGQMLQNSGIRTFVGGNIGNPLIEYVSSGQKEQLVVAEISSFQLDTIDRFHPHIGIVLNITEDHLDRYPDFEAYADSKIRIFKNQQADDVAVLNGSDPLIRAKTAHIKSQRLFFPRLQTDEQGAVLNGKRIILNLDKFEPLQPAIQIPNSKIQNQIHLDITQTALMGRHNHENVCAATLAALAAGATVEGIQQTLVEFKGLPHRLERVATINNIVFYNDSKATNVDGVLRALDCFSRPIVLLMGGRDKGGNFRMLADAIGKHVKELIVMGEAAEAIKNVLGRLKPTKMADSMDAAVATAFADANPNEVVLLSPGCASFDWYGSYAERGEDFRRAVEKLTKTAARKS
ncbi:MAG: UDP-N-acetylmuramoyl-L-alanine--D-glutamate ligase [Deltaproteobacteria bacterium]|jgi:UDP-N-acetylmuramoylalanine--D-glutamate ligase|nr:UDP-N-acetylmuramoyl-L-alanine--D-glutamate ligase [Deltaproteobacteria bacterium]